MNVDRLAMNVPVLIGLIRKEYYLTYENFSMIFGVHEKTVKNWEKGIVKPDTDMINALILAYKMIKFWKPFKLLFKLVILQSRRMISDIILKIKRK